MNKIKTRLKIKMKIRNFEKSMTKIKVSTYIKNKKVAAENYMYFRY